MAEATITISKDLFNRIVRLVNRMGRRGLRFKHVEIKPPETATEDWDFECYYDNGPDSATESD